MATSPLRSVLWLSYGVPCFMALHGMNKRCNKADNCATSTCIVLGVLDTWIYIYIYMYIQVIQTDSKSRTLGFPYFFVTGVILSVFEEEYNLKTFCKTFISWSRDMMCILSWSFHLLWQKEIHVLVVVGVIVCNDPEVWCDPSRNKIQCIFMSHKYFTCWCQPISSHLDCQRKKKQQQIKLSYI